MASAIPDDAFDTDVLVVGSGPTGSTLALALATYGVRVHVVSKRSWLADTPRAHIINQRALEVLRDLGIEESVAKVGTPWDQMGDTVFMTSLAGTEIARRRTWGTGPGRRTDYLTASPCPLLDVPQTTMEPLLVDNAARRGAHYSFDAEYLGHDQDADGVTVRLRDRINGHEYSMRARYLVGADGARSQVASDTGLPFEGEVARAGTVYVLFKADLARFVEHRPSILYWIVNPAASFGEIGMATFRAIKPWSEWILGWGFDISRGDPDVSHEALSHQVRTLLGDDSIDFEIERPMVWYVNQQYATRYQNGRVFCAGDAVHRHPPSGGLGANTCMQDAFNLAWKLAFVIQGHASESLLDTYSEERVPVGERIVNRANQSRRDYAGIREALRVDEASSDPVQAMIDRVTSSDAEGVRARALLHDALEVKDAEFNAIGVELGQRYVSAGIAPAPAVESSDTTFIPSTDPGCKIPHAWLVDERQRRLSTLDVVGKGKFSIVTGIGGRVWVEAAERLDLAFARTVVIGAPGLADAYGEWRDRSGLEEAACLLVRPDGYIAWRAEAASSAEEAEAQLRDAVGVALAAY